MPTDGPEHTLVAGGPGPGGPPYPGMPPGPASLPPPPLTARYGTDMSPEGHGQKRKQRRGLIAVIVVVILALIAGVVGWYIGVGRFTTTPDLTNRTLSEATTLAEDEGLGVDVVSEEFSETVPEGLIISTDPEGGERIPDGDTIEVVISRGKERFQVPDVLGATLEEATSQLTDANLVVGDVTEKHNGKYDEGTIADMSIDPGTRVKGGITIDLVISKGPVPIEIVDYTGRWAGRAKRGLEDAGFRVETDRQYDDVIPANKVMSQDPSEGIGHKGDVITLVVSGGPEAVPIPTVIGWDQRDARLALEDAGFKVDIERADNWIGLRKVLGQEPSSGTLPWGSTITLTVI
jgi:beta-lactam-binding protein with PASTA domain